MIVHTLIHKKLDQACISAIIKREMEETSDPNVLFRGNSLGTKAVDFYMKINGLPFLKSTFADLIENVYKNKENCEIDEGKLEKPEDAKKNAKKLLAYVHQFWEAIMNSTDRFPNELKHLFHFVHETASRIFPSHPNSKYLAVSSFLFLRLLCPSILSPKMFGVYDEHPEGNVSRTLTYIAKTLQNLANLADFAVKEPHMTFMNTFISESMENMKMTIEKFSVIILMTF